MILEALKPAWLDEARWMLQGPPVEKMLSIISPSGKGLNAGFGGGLYEDLLKRKLPGCTMIDTDLSGPPAAYDRSQGRFVNASLEALPFEKETFNFCLCTEVLEHVPDDTRAVRELYRILKPGAWLVMSVPTPPAPFDPNHAREGYKLDDLRKLLEVNGFRLVSYQFCFFFFMRALYNLWQWQFLKLGHSKKNFFPRFLLRAFAFLDERLPLGKPWDLIVCVQKR